MKISYHGDTDSLYMHLKEVATVESEEVAPDTVLHFDEDGNVTGIELYSEASKRVDLSKIEVFGVEDEQTLIARVDDTGYASRLFDEIINTLSCKAEGGKLRLLQREVV